MAFVAGTLDSWTATVPTERSVATVTALGAICQAFLDAKNMVHGDIVVITVYQKIATAETKQIAGQWTVRDAQAMPFVFSPQLSNVGEYCELTVNQIAGTGRAFKACLSSWT